CGELFSICPFWSNVSRRLKTKLLDFSEAANEISTKEDWLGFFFPSFWRDGSRNYETISGAFFEAVQAQSNAEIAVDSSKSAYTCMWRATALHRYSNIDLKVIHLYRSPEEVYRSLKKGRNKDLEVGLVSSSSTRRMLGLIVGWLTSNWAA